MQTSKAERKGELIAIISKPGGLAELRRLACEALGRSPGYLPDSEIGSTQWHYIRTILDAEFPGDDSISSALP